MVGGPRTARPKPARAASPRDRLILDFAPLARRLARRYSAHASAEDLEQVAMLALVKAADRYDRAHRTAFATYAIPTIIGELKHFLRDHSWDVHVPRRVQERTLLLRQAADELAAESGRMPTVDELARRLGFDRAETLEALEAAGARNARSLDAPARPAEGEPSLRSLAELGCDDAGLTRAVQRADLRRALAALSSQERQMVALRFFADMSQSEIARRLGVSQMQVSRTLRRALSVMREVSCAQPARPAGAGVARPRAAGGG
jgi:RNA polymerase sigma-B factor